MQKIINRIGLGDLKEEMFRKNMFSYLILMIDDDEDFAAEAGKQAKTKHGLNMAHYSTLEDAKKYIKSSAGENVKGVILDIECFRNADRTELDESFITAATKYFASYHPTLPIAVLTGKPNLQLKWKELHKESYEVFPKTNLDDIFSYLRGQIARQQDEDIKWEHKSIFQIIGKYFDREAEQKLLLCIKNIGEFSSDDKANLNLRKSTVALLRELQESLYYALNRVDPEMVPADRISSEYSLNESVLKHLKGNYDGSRATTTEYIKHGSNTDRLFYFVYKGCSAYLHSNEDKKNQETSNYTVKALVYAFLDLLLWFKTMAEQER